MKSLFLGLAFLVSSSVAASAAVDCAKNYDDFWQKLIQNGSAKLSSEQIVSINRMGVRAYDACQSGDDFATTFFDRLQQSGNSKDFWQKLAESGNAKKK